MRSLRDKDERLYRNSSIFSLLGYGHATHSEVPTCSSTSTGKARAKVRATALRMWQRKSGSASLKVFRTCKTPWMRPTHKAQTVTGRDADASYGNTAARTCGSSETASGTCSNCFSVHLECRTSRLQVRTIAATLSRAMVDQCSGYISAIMA